MQPLSFRADAMPASPIRRLAPFAEAAAKRGVSILHLNIGQPDLPSPAAFWDGLRAAETRTLEYGHAAGSAELREAAAAHYRGIGIEVEARHILVTNGGSEALAFAMGAVLNPGDEVVVPEPFYANYLGFGAWSGARLVPVPCRIEDGFALPNIEEFEARITPATRAVLMNNPNNPTGAVFSREAVLEIGRLCKERGLWLISDEVYRDFDFTEGPLLSALQVPGLETAVMVDSVSKRFSLCGARVGFLVCRHERLVDTALRMGQARLCPATLEQAGALAAMRSAGPEYFAGAREEYRRRRDMLVARLRAVPGVVCPEVQGAFYAMVRLPVDDGDRFCRWLLEEFSHSGETVMLAPGSGFYSTPGQGRDEVRVAYVLDEARLARAMDVLEAALARYPGRQVPAAAQ
jgi:aspartate aminotransferase